MMKRRCGRFMLLMPVIVALIAGVLGLVVYGLWNGVLTDVTGVKAITYWQALGLLVLARVLVGGFPRPGGRFGPRGRIMMEHWESLTPEQREKLRAGGVGRGCWGGAWPEEKAAGAGGGAEKDAGVEPGAGA